MVLDEVEFAGRGAFHLFEEGSKLMFRFIVFFLRPEDLNQSFLGSELGRVEIDSLSVEGFCEVGQVS